MQGPSASSGSSISRSWSNHGYESLRHSNHSIVGEVEEIDIANHIDRYSRTATPSETPHHFADEIDLSFDGSSAFELRPLAVQPDREGHESPNPSRVNTAVQAHTTYSVIPIHDEVERIRQPMWTPLALRWTSLTAFGLAFAVILATLEILFYFSQRNNGLGQADAKYYYLWTYGPTASTAKDFLPCFDTKADSKSSSNNCYSPLGQVEYRFKQLTPWQALRHGPVEAARSLLLDYVSPWNVVAFFKPIEAGHHFVTITIWATLLIKLVIVFSTGLLVLNDVMIQNIPADFIATDRFDSSNFDLSEIDGTAASTVAGTSLFNLSYPLGTTVGQAYQSFNTSSSVPNITSTLIGLVESFTADLECESAALRQYSQIYLNPPNCENLGLSLQLVSSSCDTEDFVGFKFWRHIGDKDVFYGSLPQLGALLRHRQETLIVW
jgi:Protein of unknown function (DUF3433)